MPHDHSLPMPRVGLERHPLERPVVPLQEERAVYDMHGFDGCPSCVKLKRWFAGHEIPFAFFDHPDQAERQLWYDAQERTRDEWGVAGGLASRTMPQVFLDGTCLGVSSETVMQYTPKLLRALAE